MTQLQSGHQWGEWDEWTQAHAADAPQFEPCSTLGGTIDYRNFAGVMGERHASTYEIGAALLSWFGENNRGGDK